MRPGIRLRGSKPLSRPALQGYQVTKATPKGGKTLLATAKTEAAPAPHMAAPAKPIPAWFRRRTSLAQGWSASFLFSSLLVVSAIVGLIFAALVFVKSEKRWLI
jgi:hypothetical protein